MGKKNKRESFFWTSYSDLMTSLFFVMLVLFILTIALLHRKMVEIEQGRKATEEQLAKIIKLESSIQNIDPKYFEYNEQFKRHTLKNIAVKFKYRSSNIYDIPDSDLDKLYQAGLSIRSFMKKAQDSLPDAEYMLIVEGQSSRDNYSKNYELSYQRALSLVKYWKSRDITFDDLPCELIISGSGCSSRFRVSPDITGNEKNQRFVIHIIPKPGNFTQ